MARYIKARPKFSHGDDASLNFFDYYRAIHFQAPLARREFRAAPLTGISAKYRAYGVDSTIMRGRRGQ